MKPIDKFKELDYTKAFYDSDTDHFECGMFCIFSDNGHNWFAGTLTGIEETVDGWLYHNESNMQYKHCRAVKPVPTYLQHVIVKYESMDMYYDGFIIGEYNGKWLVMNHDKTQLVSKSRVAFVDDIKFGGEE